LDAGDHQVQLFFHTIQGGLLQHIGGVLDPVGDLFRETLGLRHHLSGRAQ